MARNDGTYKKVQSKYADPIMLIIDEWLLLKPTESEQHDILELLHRRRKSHPPSFALSMIAMAGTINWEAMTVPSRKRSWID